MCWSLLLWKAYFFVSPINPFFFIKEFSQFQSKPLRSGTVDVNLKSWHCQVSKLWAIDFDKPLYNQIHNPNQILAKTRYGFQAIHAWNFACGKFHPLLQAWIAWSMEWNFPQAKLQTIFGEQLYINFARTYTRESNCNCPCSPCCCDLSTVVFITVYLYNYLWSCFFIKSFLKVSNCQTFGNLPVSVYHLWKAFVTQPLIGWVVGHR